MHTRRRLGIYTRKREIKGTVKEYEIETNTRKKFSCAPEMKFFFFFEKVGTSASLGCPDAAMLHSPSPNMLSFHSQPLSKSLYIKLNAHANTFTCT